MAGNTGDTGDTGNAATAANMGWAGGAFFPDRVDLPFVTVPDPRSAGTPASRMSDVRIAPNGAYLMRHWAAEWSSWHMLVDFTTTNSWQSCLVPSPPPTSLTVKDWHDWPTTGLTDVNEEIDSLVRAAEDERADALGEIVSQDREFIGDFMALLGITPTSHPATHRLLHIAGLIAMFASMHFKRVHRRRRPSQVCPALRPPIPVPGHASYPSGHATQAHLMAACLNAGRDPALSTAAAGDQSAGLTALARRIARNREIAGLHYASDTLAGEQLAADLFGILNGTEMPIESGGNSRFGNAITAASQEWT